MKMYHHPHVPASEIAQRLGLRRAGRSWRGQCPACSYPAGAVLDERGGVPLLWCSSCQDRAALFAALRAASGGLLPPRAAPPDPAPEAERLAERIEKARRIWDGAYSIEPGCAAARYLARRRISHIMASPSLRWRRDVPHPGGGRHVALLAAVTGPDGTFTGIQRVFLKPDGAKAALEPQKASLGTVAGGAVRLQTSSKELVIGEGVESSAAAGAILGLPAWAAVSAGNLAKSMMLPAEIRTVVIAVDRDPAGERAAREAWRRWTAEGRALRFLKPSAAGTDAADILAARGAA